MLHLLRTRPPRRRLQAVAHPPQGVHVSSRQWDVIADAPRRYRERCHERIANATATTIMGGIAVTTYTARSTQHAAAVGRTPGRSSSSPLPGGLKADHPVLFLQQTHPRPQCTGRLQPIENIARAPVAPPARMPVSDRPGERLGTKEELGSADLDGSAANRPGEDVRCVRR